MYRTPGVVYPTRQSDLPSDLDVVDNVFAQSSPASFDGDVSGGWEEDVRRDEIDIDG